MAFSPRAILYAASKVLVSTVSLTLMQHLYSPGLTVLALYFALLLIMSIFSLARHYWPLMSCSLPLIGSRVRADRQPLGAIGSVWSLIGSGRKGDQERGSAAGV